MADKDSVRIEHIKGRYTIITTLITGTVAVLVAFVTHAFTANNSVPVSKYNEIAEHYDALSFESKRLEESYAELTNNFDTLMSDNSALSADYEKLVDENDSLKDQIRDRNDADSSYDELLTQYEHLQLKYDDLYRNFNAMQSEDDTLERAPNQSIDVNEPTETIAEVSVSLYELDDFTNNGIITTSSDSAVYEEYTRDNLGNVHNNALFCVFRPYVSNDGNVTYKTFGEYVRLEGVYYCTFDNRSSASVSTVTIYGDEQILYTAEVSAGIDPVAFAIDLTGIEELKIDLQGSYAAIGDATLYK